MIYGYTAYTALIESLFPGKTCISTGMRQEQERVRLALDAAQTQNCALVCTQVDMFTTVFIGNSETTVIGGKMVTPRGYRHG